MKLLGRKKHNGQDPRDSDDAGTTDVAIHNGSGDGPDGGSDSAGARRRGRSRTTPPKGRPTPKRKEAERRRGPVAPAPMTAAEARRRRKELRKSMTKEERKAERARRRAEMAERRERMMAGEEAYLLPRDKGPVRRYVRDVVDSRRRLLGLFMPAALFMIFVMLGVPSLQVQQAVSTAMLLLVVIMVIDGFLLGRKVNRMVAEKFPDNTESGWRLGFYAASRASQMRRMRAPRPQVKPGDKVT